MCVRKKIYRKKFSGTHFDLSTSLLKDSVDGFLSILQEKKTFVKIAEIFQFTLPNFT